MQKKMDHMEQFQTQFSTEQVSQINNAIALVKHLTQSEKLMLKGREITALLMAINVDAETIIAAILADPVVAQLYQQVELVEQFGSSVGILVNDVSRLNQLQIYSTDMTKQPSQAETLRRMLLSMIHDARAVLIKLAYRIVRLRHLATEDYDLRRFIAQETLDIYAPIANRLGVSQLKWELEDLSFRYLHPQKYTQLVKSLDASRTQREQIIRSFKDSLQQMLKGEGIVADVAGRPKHIFSIHKKMQRKQMQVDELYDLLAVRVLVPELTSCYAVLGLVHGEWQYIPKEFDDYISNPKGNGYQSLHTVIVNPEGHRIEVQIRTHQMHEFAELGVAAHWRYKEGSKQNASTEKNIASLRQLLVDKPSDEELVDSFKTELFYDRVYVLSPAGKLIDLIKGSTPLDFAYAIHTEIGHRCRGAKVNGRIVPLTYILKSGEQVEILTAKEVEPNAHWIDSNLGYLKNPRAINKVKNWFKHQNDEKNIALGESILDKELHQSPVMVGVGLQKIVEHFKKSKPDALFLAIGRGEITENQIFSFLNRPEKEQRKRKKTNNAPGKVSVLIDGMSNVSSSLAHCCNPMYGDEIVGFISHNRGITIHRAHCENIEHLSRMQQTQLIPVQWDAGAS
ncbi:MAG: RelA/SpoT family protein [Mariprofundales bacterium]